jgi:hypothetical protein
MASLTPSPMVQSATSSSIGPSKRAKWPLDSLGPPDPLAVVLDGPGRLSHLGKAAEQPLIHFLLAHVDPGFFAGGGTTNLFVILVMMTSAIFLQAAEVRCTGSSPHSAASAITHSEPEIARPYKPIILFRQRTQKLGVC